MRFGHILTSNPDVNAYVIFIGSLGNQAQRSFLFVILPILIHCSAITYFKHAHYKPSVVIEKYS